MGFYINHIPSGEVLQPLGKVLALVQKAGAEVIPTPQDFTAVPSDKALLCAVHNGPFEAVAYCFDAREFQAFNHPSDDRPKAWMTMDKSTVERLSGYTERKN